MSWQERRLELEMKRLAQIEARKQEAVLEAQRRELTAQAAKRDEDTRLTLLELRMAAEAEAVARITADEKKEAALKRERNRLEAEIKSDAVERAKRRDDYRRLVVSNQIKEKQDRGAARQEVRD